MFFLMKAVEGSSVEKYTPARLNVATAHEKMYRKRDQDDSPGAQEDKRQA